MKYWELASFRKWVTTAVAVLRELKGSFPGEGDLVWRAEAAHRLEEEGPTLEAILHDLPIATEVMEIVD